MAILPWYVILFVWYGDDISMMSDVANMLNDVFADTVDTPKKSVDQHRNWVCLKGDKKQWTHERVDKASNRFINKKMRRIKKTGKAVGKHIISLYSSGISHVV